MKWTDQDIIDDYGEEISLLAAELQAENREDKIECILKVLRLHKRDLCAATLNWNYLIKNIKWERDYGTR